MTSDISRHDAYCAFMRRHRSTVWHVCWRFARGEIPRCEDMVLVHTSAYGLQIAHLRPTHLSVYSSTPLVQS
ncbi:MAG: hypothetical protein K5650_07105 [Bacteroidales bacterium]|nr:hypothetical protein [Bacteroidales bacterium]